MNSLLFRLQIYKRNNITKLHLRPPLCPILRQEAFILENTWPPVPVGMESLGLHCTTPTESIFVNSIKLDASGDHLVKEFVI